jgi:cytochrome c oxidase subunit 3
VLLLALVYRLAGSGRFTPDSHWGISAIVMYWHFVDVVWVFFYPTLYLLK